MSRRALAVALTIAVSVTLGGCAPSTPAPDDAVAAQLQQTVLDVTIAITDEDWTAADADLDALEAQIDAALESGELSAERAAEIRSAIELVRADVAAGSDEQGADPEPTETPERDKPGNGNGNNKKP